MTPKTMTINALAVGIAALMLYGSAQAQSAMPDSAGGRYIFSRRDNGFIRLDTMTGEVATCSPKAIGLACQAAPEDRAVLESEIARLRRENAELKKELIVRGLDLPPGVMPEPPLAHNEAPSAPGDTDVDRMVALAGRVWQRLLDAIAQAQKQFFNKS